MRIGIGIREGEKSYKKINVQKNDSSERILHQYDASAKWLSATRSVQFSKERASIDMKKVPSVLYFPTML